MLLTIRSRMYMTQLMPGLAFLTAIEEQYDVSCIGCSAHGARRRRRETRVQRAAMGADAAHQLAGDTKRRRTLIFGTLQYAASHLHTPLFVVLGHSSCGAVKAALASKFQGAEHKSRIEVLLENILPALDGLDPNQPPDALVRSAVEANVRHTIKELLETPEGKARVAESKMKLVGAVYDLETGRVEFIE